MTAPNVNTSAWRLPSKNKAGAKRAGDFGRDAYAKLGLAGIVEGAEGKKDAPPPEGYVEGREEGRAPITSSGGLPTVDTSGWSLSEAKKPKGPPSERGKKWNRDTPPDRHGRPVLFGGDGEEKEDTGRTAVKMAGKTEMKGLSMDRIAQLRRLAGLEQTEETEFALGTPHRRMPSDERAVPRREIQESRELGSTSRLPAEVRRLVEPSASLPSGGHVPHRATGSGILDPVTEGEDHGAAYVDRVLAESQWFLKDFSRLALGRPTLGEEPRREPWKGSGPDYSDQMVDPGDHADDDEPKKKKAPKPKAKAQDDVDEPDDEPEDDDDDDDMEEGRSRRILVKHTGPGGRGPKIRMHRQSPEQKHRNKMTSTKQSKKRWERDHKAQRRRSARLRRHHAGMESIDLDEFTPEAIEERLGDVLKKVGGRMSQGTKQSRDIVDKAKSKVKGAYDKWHSGEKKKHSRRKKAKARLRRMKAKKRAAAKAKRAAG